jgi:hypothetical protein
MHLVDGIGKRFIKLFTGDVKANICSKLPITSVIFSETCRRNEDIKAKIKEWGLTKPQRDKVDERWASVKLPNGQGTNYLPFADSATFTSADWLHLIIYAGRWIMDGILGGVQLDVWLRFCRVVETLASTSFLNHPASYEIIRKFVNDTVAILEATLPATELVMKFHNLIHVVPTIIDKGPLHGYWLFRCVHLIVINLIYLKTAIAQRLQLQELPLRFERQWGAITQSLRASSNRAHVQASLVKVVKNQWRCVEPVFSNNLNMQGARAAPDKVRAIIDWQGCDNLSFTLWNGKDAIAVSRGGWKEQSEWKIGPHLPTRVTERLEELSTDLGESMRAGDHISLESCPGLTIMDRPFSPYNGSCIQTDMMAFQEGQLYRSYVMVSENKTRQRYRKCAGQVNTVYRITICRSGCDDRIREFCQMTLFEIKREPLRDAPKEGSSDAIHSLMDIIDKPSTTYRAGRSQRRPRFIELTAIYSACIIVPRVAVPESTRSHEDLRYHPYHLIQLRRD